MRDLSNSVVKTIKPPVQTNEIFYGGTASLILSSTTSVVLYDIQQQKTIAEVNSPAVKYVSWSADGGMVALLSKHSMLNIPFIGGFTDKGLFSYNHRQPQLLAVVFDS